MSGRTTDRHRSNRLTLRGRGLVSHLLSPTPEIGGPTEGWSGVTRHQYKEMTFGVEVGRRDRGLVEVFDERVEYDSPDPSLPNVRDDR